MNNHQWMGNPDIKGWIYTDVTRETKCPKCQSDAGYLCETPQGRRVKYPHTERVTAYTSQHFGVE